MGGGGQKKNRSTFGDITNAGAPPGKQVRFFLFLLSARLVFFSNSPRSFFFAHLFRSLFLAPYHTLNPSLQPSPARCAEISRAQQGGGNQHRERPSLPTSSSGRNAADPSPTTAAGCSSSSWQLPFVPPRPVVDPIDAGDVSDTLACVEYVQDIMESLYDSEVKIGERKTREDERETKRIEKKKLNLDLNGTRPVVQKKKSKQRRSRPATCYLEAVQTEVNASMRGILVDWLVEVAAEFRLVSDTLFSAVGYVDRVLSLRPVPRARLQLVGVACMLLASKYEEIYAPQVDEFVFITDNTYTRDELLAAEAEALGDLRFSLSAPTAKTFLRRFVKAALGDGLGSAEADAKLPPLAAYVCELALLEYDAVAFLPSQVAAASVVVARHVLGSEAAAAKGSRQQQQPAPAHLWSPALARSYGAREGGGGGGGCSTSFAASSLPPPPFSLTSTLAAASSAAPPSSSNLLCPPELSRPVALLHGALCRAKDGPLPAVRDKYGAAAYRCVAAMPPPLPAEF